MDSLTLEKDNSKNNDNNGQQVDRGHLMEEEEEIWPSTAVNSSSIYCAGPIQGVKYPIEACALGGQYMLS